MAGRVDRPTAEERQRRADQELREELAADLDDGALARWNEMDELWESGEIAKMIENGDFSDLPDEFRPD